MIRWTIAVFEFKRFLKWKQELMSIGFMLLTFAVMSAWPHIKGFIDKDYRVAIVTAAQLPEVEGFVFSKLDAAALEGAKAELGERWDLLVNSSGGSLAITGTQSASWHEKLTSQLQRWYQQQQISALPLTGEQRQVIDTLPEVNFSFTKEQTGDEQERKVRKVVSMVFLGLLIMGYFASFGLMFTAITGEKQQRVTEQLLTLVSAREWIDGKVIGISLFSLKTILTYGVMALLLIQGAAMISGKGGLSLPLGVLDMLGMLLFLGLGLLMLNTFLAGFAATIDDPNHSGRSMVMLLPGVLMGLVFAVMDNIEGQLMQVLSWLPLTSFAAMPMRIAAGEVAWWELLGSLGLLAAFVVWLANASARVFELGIRMYGKEPGWGDIASAVFNRRG
ncbi:ABC transporter permease [Shewanella sp. JM162201]|uniref:ABC transporter permease n=1 Tax=Shewanella jiangmenensis TaxID=2837387 RepID=A0ABS5VAN3_9GAMM|nr:ABC transporter permease [Shewanella jiangmenensis]MBT1446098.1 ABC transporter permease [Shewanella jiangmenensis]